MVSSWCPRFPGSDKNDWRLKDVFFMKKQFDSAKLVTLCVPGDKKSAADTASSESLYWSSSWQIPIDSIQQQQQQVPDLHSDIPGITGMTLPRGPGLQLGRYRCGRCGKCYSYDSGLIRHRKQCYGVYNYHCGACGKKFHRKDHLTRHQKSTRH